MALNSTSTIKLIDLLSEGPVAGIVGTTRGIFLDETPIKTGDDFNFLKEDVSYDFKPGGRTQDQLNQGKDGTSTITSVNAEVGSNYSEKTDANNKVTARDYGSGQQIRQITDTDVESFEIIFGIPRLYSTAVEGLARGQLFNGKLQIRVHVQPRGGSYTKVYDRTITGISTSDYQIKTPRIKLRGTGPWNIKVTKVNLKEDHFEVKVSNFEDVDKKTPQGSNRGNQLIWNALIEVQSLRTAYPYCAVAGLSISTRQFSSLPTRAYKIRGRLVQIPSNATVRTDGSLLFTGAFNGELKRAWTTCPVCCWYDMLTNKRYGAGDFVAAENVSWVDLYPLAQYANQLITTPDGEREARFACNTVISSQAEAFNVLQDLASIFRGMLYWQTNTIQAIGDHGNLDGTALSPVHLYSNSNVINGAFEYSGTSLKTRSTSIRVRYNDPENFYKSNYVVVEDAALITKYGYQLKEIVAMGATSKWQAQRMGRWMLASEELDGEIVTFTTGLQGAVVLPGQIFAVADEMRQGARLAGRVASSTTTSITADQIITLPSGSNFKVTVTLADGSIETRTISTTSSSTINVGTAFTSAPLEQSIWSVTSTDVEQQKFRCLSTADNGNGQYTVVGTQHNDSIYATADTGRDLKFQDVTTFDDAARKPTGLTIATRPVRKNNNVVNQVTLAWTRVTSGKSFKYQVRYKVGDGNYETVETTNTRVTLEGLRIGAVVTFQIRCLAQFKNSAWVTTKFTVPSKATKTPITANSPIAPPVEPDNPTPEPEEVVVLPPDPRQLTIEAVGTDQVILRWQVPPTGEGATADRLTAVIRHNRKTDGTGTWQNSSELTKVKATTNIATLPAMNGEYLIKFVDDEKLKSENAVSATFELPDAIPRLQVQLRREDQDSPPFQGQKVDCFYSDEEEYDGLVLAGDETIDDVVENIDDLSSFDFTGDRLSAGEYYFASTLDLGAKYNILFTRILEERGIYPADLIDERTVNIDRWADFDGTIADETSAELFFRVSDQGIVEENYLLENAENFLLEDGSQLDYESNAVFGNWVPMRTGRFTGRLFQFKAELSTDAQDQTPLIDELGYLFQFESRTENSNPIASGAGAKAVTFTNAFYQEPSIGINAFNLASGDYYEVTSTSRTGFTVTFRNSSNAAVDRNFTYSAVGFGTQQS